MMSMYQKSSTVAYVFKFKEIATYINWEDVFLTAQFYTELKDVIKDNITWENWSEML